MPTSVPAAPRAAQPAKRPAVATRVQLQKTNDPAQKKTEKQVESAPNDPPNSQIISEFDASSAESVWKQALSQIEDMTADYASFYHHVAISAPNHLVVSFEARYTLQKESLERPERRATVERSTNETKICVSVNLDSADTIQINTGIGFYDHMLEQIAKHGDFGLVIQCEGDLEIDEHHTVEDTAICLGNALRKALGNKMGIGRYGFVLPMDESEAKVAIDLSGRAAFKFDADFPRDSVGELSTEMVEHFFRSLAAALGAAIHVEIRGENTHHMIESGFKAVGRSLRQAIARTGTDLPSTKGSL
jgi:imidazoleglycerol phosphate dehydratase HisB